MVTTATGQGGYRSTSYRELGAQASPNWRTGCAVSASPRDQRVGTFMWNNTEHLAVYLAAPAMGAVLHTLNIRLSAEQIAFIANEAEDQVIVAGRLADTAAGSGAAAAEHGAHRDRRR